MVQELLARRDRKGNTPLAAACAGGHLLSKGAEVEQASRDGGTALHIACVNVYDSIVELLLSNGADPFVGDTYAIYTGDASRQAIARMLVEHVAKAGRCDGCGAPRTDDAHVATAEHARPLHHHRMLSSPLLIPRRHGRSQVRDLQLGALLLQGVPGDDACGSFVAL